MTCIASFLIVLFVASVLAGRNEHLPVRAVARRARRSPGTARFSD